MLERFYSVKVCIYKAFIEIMCQMSNNLTFVILIKSAKVQNKTQTNH
jgi:hypothetical protein